MKGANIAIVVIFLSQPALGQATPNSTTSEPLSTRHSLAKDVLVSVLFGAGGLGAGILMSPRVPVVLGGWYIGTLLGTAIVHRDFHVYPIELLLTGAGIGLGFIAIGIAQFAGYSGDYVFSNVGFALAITLPGMGATTGFHLGKARTDEKATEHYSIRRGRTACTAFVIPAA